MARLGGAFTASRHARITFAIFFNDLKLFTMHCNKKTNWGNTMQGQSRTSSKRHAPARVTARPEYTAAVRYLDGRCEIFRVRNADDIADARELVLSELGDVRSVVIALRH